MTFKLIDIYRQINEGLIKSVDPEYFESSMVGVSSGISSSASIITGQTHDTWQVEVEFDDGEEGYTKWNIFKKYYKKMNQKAKLMGWFPALVKIYGFDKNGNQSPDVGYMDDWHKVNSIENVDFDYDEVWVQVVYEAKYDILKYDRDSIPSEELFHMTDKKHLPKIKRIGLVPKAGEKHSKHPDRIYFTLNYDDAKKLILMGLGDYIEGLPVILKIDVNKLQKKFIAYGDPQYKNGFYTYNNIPSNAITVMKND